MHLACTLAQALFPAEGQRLFNDKPLPLQLDCHDGNTFILKVGGLAVQPLESEGAAAEITLEVSLAPPAAVLSQLEDFAAHQELALTLTPAPPAELTAPLTLAACHLPGPKLFVFSENATLTVRATPEGKVRLAVQGEFKSRQAPCREIDLLLHLERPQAGRLLSFCFTLVRGKV